LSDEASGRNVDNELANRLDTLFDEDEADSARPGGETADPLDELKSLVMSIEWEITDDLMGRFIAQVEILRKRYEEDRILVMFLQLLGSLGLYVKSNKAGAHPAAFRLLNSVYASFANAAMPGKISSSEKKKLLYVELNKYKELKEQIGLSRDATKELPMEKSSRQASSAPQDSDNSAQRTVQKPPPGQPSSTSPALVTSQQFEDAMASIKQFIQSEFKVLRETLVQDLKN
jgi:hypothetical protein